MPSLGPAFFSVKLVRGNNIDPACQGGRRRLSCDARCGHPASAQSTHVGCCCHLRTTACKGLYETKDEVPREEGRGPSAQELSLHLTLMHAHAYTYMCTRESTCTHTYTTHTHSLMQTLVCARRYTAHTRARIHTHTHTLTLAHTPTYARPHAHTHVEVAPLLTETAARADPRPTLHAPPLPAGPPHWQCKRFLNEGREAVFSKLFKIQLKKKNQWQLKMATDLGGGRAQRSTCVLSSQARGHTLRLEFDTSL